MRLGYHILVSRDRNNKIKSLYSPDFDLDLLKADDSFHEQVCGDYRELAKVALQGHLENLNLLELPVPKKLSYFQEINLKNNQHWEKIYINFDCKAGLFERNFPRIGHSLNIISLLSNAVITYLALRITTDKKSGFLPVNLVATGISFFLVLIMYIYSNASGCLETLGKKTDNFFKKKRQQDNLLANEPVIISEKRPSTSYIYITSACLAGTAMLISTGSSAITNYQEVVSLGHRSISANDSSNQQLFLWLMVILAVINSSSHAISVLAFRASFITLCIYHICKILQTYCTSAPHNESKELVRLKGVILQLSSEVTSDVEEHLNEEFKKNEFIM